MKRFLVQWLSILCLCLALLGLPVILGACSFKLDMGTPAPLGSSSRNPYVISVSQGTCTSWRVVLDGVGGKAWCASFMPAAHVGDYVQLSYGVLSQDFRVVSVDVQQHRVSVGNM